MNRKMFYILGAIVLVLSLVLGACAPAATETAAPAEPETTEEAMPEETEEAMPEETEEPMEETEEPMEETEEPMAEEPSVFIFGRGGDSVQLDPAVVTDGESFRVTGQVLEPLYQYDKGSTVPIPALAESCEANEDATEWTCKLREGVKFHDGTDFNADAVVFNFERWRFTDNPYHFDTQVFEYYEYMWGGLDDASTITAVEAVDDYTVKFTLNAPLAPFLANLAMDMFAIASPTAIEQAGEDYGTPAVGCVGTGPFKFVEWTEGDHITIEANTEYWGGAPTVDQVIFRVIPDDSARFLALQAGDIHGLEQAVIEDLESAEADPNLYVQDSTSAKYWLSGFQLCN
jgi:peptide/nickel transport system substrate-binding protein